MAPVDLIYTVANSGQAVSILNKLKSISIISLSATSKI